jgi:hypothetical protein
LFPFLSLQWFLVKARIRKEEERKRERKEKDHKFVYLIVFTTSKEFTSEEEISQICFSTFIAHLGPDLIYVASSR